MHDMSVYRGGRELCNPQAHGHCFSLGWGFFTCASTRVLCNIMRAIDWYGSESPWLPPWLFASNLAYSIGASVKVFVDE